MNTRNTNGPIGRIKVGYWFARRAILERLNFWISNELYLAEAYLKDAALRQLDMDTSLDPLQYELRYCEEGALRMDPIPGKGLDVYLRDPTDAVVIYANGKVEKDGEYFHG